MVKRKQQIAYASIQRIEGFIKKTGTVKILDDVDSIREYILHLERENFGLKTTVENQRRKLDKRFVGSTPWTRISEVVKKSRKG